MPSSGTDRIPRAERGWWGRNRLALLAIPILLALVVAANGSRLERYWWNTDLRSATTGQQGEFIRFQQDFTDAVGDTSRTLEIRLDDLTDLDEIPSAYGAPAPIPDGLRGVRVDLSFKADPDQPLQGCWLGLVDEDGTRYEFDTTFADTSQTESFPCYEFGKPGPRTPFMPGDKRVTNPGEERPAAWQTHPIVFVPEDVRITEMVMWWYGLPEHVRVQVRD